MQEATGYRLEVATVRRLEFENDTFAFGDKLIKKWYSGEQRVRRAAQLAVARGAMGTAGCFPAADCVAPAARCRLQPCSSGRHTCSSLQSLAAGGPCWLQDKAGILLVVSAGKDGALTGGDAFMQVCCCCEAQCRAWL